VGEPYRPLRSSLCSSLYSPVTSTPLGPNILLITLVSNTLSLRSCLNVSDQVSHPYKTVLYNLNLYTFGWRSVKDSEPNDSKHSLTSICSQFLPQ
jgi:hypothetical protein